MNFDKYFGRFLTELWPLIDVRILFMLKGVVLFSGITGEEGSELQKEFDKGINSHQLSLSAS